MNKGSDFSLVVLISGAGSNLQAIIDAIAQKPIAAHISAVISNKGDAAGLEKARQAGIDAHYIDHKTFDSREDFDQALTQKINNYQPDLIVLAGFMRILSSSFVNQFLGKMINVHPSLLPAHKGLNTHQKALDAGDEHHGCSVHYVTAELDGGPVISQQETLIETNDSAVSLQGKVQKLEHGLLPEVIQWIVNDKVKLINNQVQFKD